MTNETPQPNANIRRQSCMEITVFIDFFGEGGALITAWFEGGVFRSFDEVR